MLILVALSHLSQIHADEDVQFFVAPGEFISYFERMKIFEGHAVEVNIDQLVLKVFLVQNLNCMGSCADKHKEIEQRQSEEEDSVDQHCEDGNDVDDLKGSPAVLDVTMLDILIYELFSLLTFLRFLWLNWLNFNKSARRVLHDGIIEFENTEVNGKDEEPKEGHLECLSIYIVFTADCQITEDIEGHDHVEASDCLTYGN